jgi:hypothetical protein
MTLDACVAVMKEIQYVENEPDYQQLINTI